MVSPWLALLITSGVHAANLSHIRGVAGAGWLHLEDWMYSFPMGNTLPPTSYPYSLVDTQRDSPQGRLFPSDLYRAQPFAADTHYSTIPPWFSEGELVTQTIQEIGANRTIELFKTHRDQYWTDEDLSLMSQYGINTVRLNVGWWAFPSFPLPQHEGIVQDLCYPNMSFVTLSEPFINQLLDQFKAHGLTVLIDIHAMPCGSSDGTYNGVYPLPPVFFNHAAAQSYGTEVLKNMLSWFLALSTERQEVIHGFTLLNEPGHLTVPTYTATSDPMVQWMKQAVQLYENMLVSKTTTPPFLYMNLIGTAFAVLPQCCNGISDTLSCMAHVTANQFGLANKSWAVLDLHHYFAWDSGSGINDCASDASLTGYVKSGMDSFTDELVTKATAVGLTNFATSEWSLCTHRNDTQMCAAPDEGSIMYEQQMEGFAEAGFANFFWGWRMPYGGWHETKWSLKKHFTGQS